MTFLRAHRWHVSLTYRQATFKRRSFKLLSSLQVLVHGSSALQRSTHLGSPEESGKGRGEKKKKSQQGIPIVWRVTFPLLFRLSPLRNRSESNFLYLELPCRNSPATEKNANKQIEATGLLLLTLSLQPSDQTLRCSPLFFQAFPNRAGNQSELTRTRLKQKINTLRIPVFHKETRVLDALWQSTV